MKLTQEIPRNDVKNLLHAAYFCGLTTGLEQKRATHPQSKEERTKLIALLDSLPLPEIDPNSAN